MNIAIIDTETTWHDRVMSIGVVIADSKRYKPIDTKYYILTPEYKEGGMFSNVIEYDTTPVDLKDSRRKVIVDLADFLEQYHVSKLFAYNANFDKSHLPELRHYQWYDIMKIAAYKQYNKSLPDHLEYCLTGRLKRGYGVEPILQMLKKDMWFSEVHNALCDAIDELTIMRLLKQSIEVYENARI